MERWYIGVQHVTESVLTWRKRKKLRQKEKQKRRHPIIEWLDAFLWAAVVVLLINQYLFQAYQIPTPSMEDTLKVRDRIFVNKLVYGPELLPGVLKLPGYANPLRHKIIIFESPTYLSKGTLFDIVQRVLYMLTLSLVDIDRDENGQPRAHFLIKRAVGVEKDRVRVRNGEVEIQPPGLGIWISEPLFRKHPAEGGFQVKDAIEFDTRRFIKAEDYPTIRASVRVRELEDLGLEPHPQETGLVKSATTVKNDSFQRMAERARVLHEVLPHEVRYRSELQRYILGWYVPEGWIFPMGDNRDNSNDARYFGPVRLSKVLGKAMFIYWPLNRIGAAR